MKYISHSVYDLSFHRYWNEGRQLPTECKMGELKSKKETVWCVLRTFILLSFYNNTHHKRNTVNWFLVMYSKQRILGLTQEWFRELSFSRLECGVHDRLHIYRLCRIFSFPWHRHQIEGTNGLPCLIQKTQAMWGKRTCLSFEAALQPLSYQAPQEIHKV